MHVVAMKPVYVDAASVPAEVAAEQRAALAEKQVRSITPNLPTHISAQQRHLAARRAGGALFTCIELILPVLRRRTTPSPLLSSPRSSTASSRSGALPHPPTPDLGSLKFLASDAYGVGGGCPSRLIRMSEVCLNQQQFMLDDTVTVKARQFTSYRAWNLICPGRMRGGRAARPTTADQAQFRTTGGDRQGKRGRRKLKGVGLFPYGGGRGGAEGGEEFR